MRYLVTWEIDIYARSPREAARKARAIQLDPENIATFYRVRNTHTNKERLVDLSTDPSPTKKGA